MKFTIYPECMYPMSSYTDDELRKALDDNEPVTGLVMNIQPEKEVLEVYLGEGLPLATLPFEEVTIYPLKESRNPKKRLPVNVACLKGKLVRAIITSIAEDAIVLSRKANMQRSFELHKTTQRGQFHVTGLSNNVAYGDIGDGITAMLRIAEVSKCYLENISERIHIGKCYEVVITSANEAAKAFEVSLKQAAKPYNISDYQVGAHVKCIVGQPVNKAQTACYCEISPQVTGIIQLYPTTPTFFTGDSVECEIIGLTPKGLKLKFFKLLI